MKLSQFQIKVCLNLLNMPTQNVSCTIGDLKVISKTSEALEEAQEDSPERPVLKQGKNEKEETKNQESFQKDMKKWDSEYEAFSKSKTSLGLDKESTSLLRLRINNFESFSSEKFIREQIIELSETLEA